MSKNWSLKIRIPNNEAGPALRKPGRSAPQKRENPWIILIYCPDNEVNRIFQRLDSIVEKIHQYAIEPIFSKDVQRRSSGAGPSYSLADDDILKRMILLIAVSQQVKSVRITKMIEDGVFDRVFAPYSPATISKFDPVELKNMYWKNPLRPNERLAPMYATSKLKSIIGCANSLLKISSSHGSFMRFIEKQGFPIKIDSISNQKKFWEAFDNTQKYLIGIMCPFFHEFTSLCHLFQDLGFDCAKPDSVIMGAAERLGIIGSTTNKGQRPLKERKLVIPIMQMYSAHKKIKTPVVDLYFLIYGGQTDAKKFVDPSFYSLSL